MDLVEQVNYASCFSFKYSSRPGTPAADRKGQVDPAASSDRLIELQALLNHQQQAFMQDMVGREVGVLFEKAGRHPGQMVGKSDHLHAVHVEAEGLQPGDLRRVKITSAGANSLAGTLL